MMEMIPNGGGLKHWLSYQLLLMLVTVICLGPAKPGKVDLFFHEVEPIVFGLLYSASAQQEIQGLVLEILYLKPEAKHTWGRLDA